MKDNDDGLQTCYYNLKDIWHVISTLMLDGSYIAVEVLARCLNLRA